MTGYTMKKPMTKIDGLLAVLEREITPLHIQIHDFSDPDAAASAFGIQQFLRVSGIETDIPAWPADSYRTCRNSTRMPLSKK